MTLNEIKVIIDDNGIGRSQSKELKTHGTGMGLKTLNKILSYYNENHKLSMSYTILDKPDDGGTTVNITILLKNV